ncbi:MAG: hypothetical protein KDC27_07490, partial [Acidobacteria bacterium]|nr:hypothetical protein [Acidobacteriota bacterium]
ISWAPGVQGGVIRVSVYPAPLSTVTASDAAAPEPRFLDSPTVWSYFSIAPCRSTLLFPYATQGAGFDTRLILDNRTANLPGVGPQAGACVLKFRGQNAPADQTTPSIAPGSQFDASLSALAPGFSGHVSAQCDFEGAAGVAILTNGAAVYESPAERLDVAEALPMLFPYAVQSATFDTRIAIANPTLDTPAGIGPASGTCRIDYFGTNAPPAQFTTEIAAGQELTFTLSGGAPAQGVAAAPGFSGYVTVNCTFPFARSFAAVTELSGGAAVRGYGYAPERFEARFTFDPTEDTGPDQDPPSALLAPYVSARGGEETLFAIANASLDTAGTVPAAGSCTLELHGDGAVSAPTPQTFTLSPGESVVFPVSQGSAAYAIAGAPDFRGYATLSCDFERARAAVLLTRAGGGTHADRAEALAIPRNPAPSALFEPYVSSRSGEDRLIAFASTAPDGFGSPTQDATCTLAFHGTGAPVSGVFLLPAGQVRAFLLSRGAPALGVPPAPAFQGFLDTSCTGGLERVVDYRVAPDATLSPFCEIDSTPGTQASDVVALTGLLGQPVAVGHPGDPDGDGIITSNDVQYCNGQSGGVQTEPDPETDPGGSGGSEGSGGNGGSGGRSTPTPEPTPSSGADLRVSWTTSAGAAKPRRGLSLTARVTNAGPQAATAATAWLAPPSALELSRLPQQCTQESTQLRCELGMIAAGQTITLELSGTVSLAAQRELVASAQVVGAEADPNQANNTAYITVPLETQVDLSVSAYLLPRFPAPGETATLTISATNRGPAWADNVSLSAELAPEIELLQTPNGCTLSGSQLRCSPGTLPTGRTRAYLLQVRVSTAGGGFQGGGGGSGFLADVTGASSTPDYALDNNTVRVVQGQ